MNVSNSIPALNCAPFVTLKEYCRLSGHNINTVKKMISEGRIPTRKKPVVNGRVQEKSIVEINMIALAMEAYGRK